MVLAKCHPCQTLMPMVWLMLTPVLRQGLMIHSLSSRRILMTQGQRDRGLPLNVPSAAKRFTLVSAMALIWMPTLMSWMGLNMQASMLRSMMAARRRMRRAVVLSFFVGCVILDRAGLFQQLRALRRPLLQMLTKVKRWGSKTPETISWPTAAGTMRGLISMCLVPSGVPFVPGSVLQYPGGGLSTGAVQLPQTPQARNILSPVRALQALLALHPLTGLGGSSQTTWVSGKLCPPLPCWAHFITAGMGCTAPPWLYVQPRYFATGPLRLDGGRLFCE